jgi:hypothetical protein
MSRRPALVTQAQVARAVRAAIQAGATCVEIKPDGTIVVQLHPQLSTGAVAEAATIDPERRIVL